MSKELQIKTQGRSCAVTVQNYREMDTGGVAKIVEPWLLPDRVALHLVHSRRHL